MAKSKINFSVLKKTADDKGVMWDKNENGTYCVGNVFAAVLNVREDEIQDVIDKTKAVELKGYSNRIKNAVDSLTNSCDVVYTGLMYDGVLENTYSFFKAQNGSVIRINSNLFELTKKMKNGSIVGQSEKHVLLFDDNIHKAIILPSVNHSPNNMETEIIKAIEKVNFFLIVHSVI